MLDPKHVEELLITNKSLIVASSWSHLYLLFIPSSSVFPCQYHSKNAPYSSSSTCQSYQMTNGTKPGNRPQIQCPFKKKTALDRKIFSHWILKGRVMNQAVNRWLNCWRHTFNTLLINVRFVVHKVAMGLDYQLVFCFSAVSTIPPTP